MRKRSTLRGSRTTEGWTNSRELVWIWTLIQMGNKKLSKTCADSFFLGGFSGCNCSFRSSSLNEQSERQSLDMMRFVQHGYSTSAGSPSPMDTEWYRPSHKNLTSSKSWQGTCVKQPSSNQTFKLEMNQGPTQTLALQKICLILLQSSSMLGRKVAYMVCVTCEHSVSCRLSSLCFAKNGRASLYLGWSLFRKRSRCNRYGVYMPQACFANHRCHSNYIYMPYTWRFSIVHLLMFIGILVWKGLPTCLCIHINTYTVYIYIIYIYIIYI